MNRKVLSMALSVVGAPLAGRLLGMLLASRPGGELLETIDRRQLTPFEHRVLARRWSGALAKAIMTAALGLFLVEQARQERGRPVMWRGLGGGGPVVNWPHLLHRTSEVLLALGAIMKVAANFLEEREEVAEEAAGGES